MLDLKKIDLIDKDVTNNLVKVFKSKIYTNLLIDAKRSLYQHKSLFLVGCASLGRLAMQIEASIRKFWLNLINIIPDRKDEFLANYNYVNSISIGSDLTIINNEIDFKDLYMIGNRQIEAEVNDGDICIVYASDGSSRAINQAAITASKIGASVYYLYNISKEKIASIDTAKSVLSNKNIIKICLDNETTNTSLFKELIYSYSVLEIISNEWLKENLIDDEYKVLIDRGLGALSINDYARCFNVINKGFQKEKTKIALTKLSEFKDSNNAYLTHNYLVDMLAILVDEQDRCNCPSFKKRMDRSTDSPKSIAFDALYPTSIAWQHVFRRNIKGLNESKNTYKLLGVNNPKITSFHSSELFDYLIGNEYDQSRYQYNLVFIDVNEHYDLEELTSFCKEGGNYKEQIVARIGNVSRNKLFSNELIIPVKLPSTCLDLFAHLIIRVLFS
ncbi:MAG: hypothetical protein J5691_03495 [Bacilli bacterium]|nr:hypothetical protein [Bacilli bacterium]